MYIPDCLVWAMEDEGCTAVKVYCEEELREAIATRFTEVFNEEYEKLMDLIGTVNISAVCKTHKTSCC